MLPLVIFSTIQGVAYLLALTTPGVTAQVCLLYTSDAADERSSVDLGGRRIINKKTKKKRKQRIVIIKKYKQVNNRQE